MPAQVVFTYCEESQNWEVKVIGVEDSTEVRQAFSAVVCTCQLLQVRLLGDTKVIPTIDGEFEINPAA